VLLSLTRSRKLLYTCVTGWLLLGNALFFWLPRHGDVQALLPGDKDEPPRSIKESLLAVPQLLYRSAAARKICLW
jgi:hypothetical protein